MYHSHCQSRDIDEGEKVLPIVNFVLSSIETLALLISENLHKKPKHILLFTSNSLNQVDHSWITAKSHVCLDYQS